jgi:hypothetical protein
MARVVIGGIACILHPNCFAPVEVIEYRRVDADAAFRRASRRSSAPAGHLLPPRPGRGRALGGTRLLSRM